MIPKFLLATNSQELPDTIFIVHNDSPKFILECDIDDFDKDQSTHWLEAKPSDKELINELLEDAREFLEKEIENEEDLFDDEE
jgi:hypothetical protein